VLDQDLSVIYGAFPMTTPEQLPQIFLAQYEKLVARFADLAAELEKEKNLRKACQEELELAELVIAGYQEPDLEIDLPHHINHNG
jgi:hypothetical protein